MEIGAAKVPPRVFPGAETERRSLRPNWNDFGPLGRNQLG
jgi:hypothetical protein